MRSQRAPAPRRPVSPGVPVSIPPRSTNRSASPPTSTTLDQFVALVGGPRGAIRTVPMIGLAQAGNGTYFDERGFPHGDGWDELGIPALEDRNAYALEISGDALWPVYRDGTSSSRRPPPRSAAAIASWSSCAAAR